MEGLRGGAYYRIHHCFESKVAWRYDNKCFLSHTRVKDRGSTEQNRRNEDWKLWFEFEEDSLYNMSRIGLDLLLE